MKNDKVRAVKKNERLIKPRMSEKKIMTGREQIR